MTSTSRRSFLLRSLTATAAAAGPAWLGASLWASELPEDDTIARVVGFDLPSRRSKVVGRNAQLDVHGERASDRMLRIFTTSGIEGLGACYAGEEEAAGLLGKRVQELFDPSQPQALALAATGTGPLWDLAGKLLERPVYELLGARGVEQVPVYDGSIYFADLLPEYAESWRDRFREELDASLAAGHRAFKVKVGRGHRWMPRAEGDARDIEVVRLVRSHVGEEALIGIDANNGYDPRGARQLLEAVGDANLAFAEEMFPETVDDCLALKEFFAEQGQGTLVADGETQGDLEAYRPLVEAEALDVLQGDMKHFGFEGIRGEAAMAAPHGIRVAPHNWGSLIGYYMQLHVGRGLENFYLAEHDPLASELLIAEGYELHAGLATVPATPGLGLALDERRFTETVEPLFDLRV